MAIRVRRNPVYSIVGRCCSYLGAFAVTIFFGAALFAIVITICPSIIHAGL